MNIIARHMLTATCILLLGCTSEPLRPGDIVINEASSRSIGNRTQAHSISGEVVNDGGHPRSTVTVITMEVFVSDEVHALGQSNSGERPANKPWLFTRRITYQCTTDPGSYTADYEIDLEVVIDTRKREITILGDTMPFELGDRFRIAVNSPDAIDVARVDDE